MSCNSDSTSSYSTETESCAYGTYKTSDSSSCSSTDCSSSSKCTICSSSTCTCSTSSSTCPSSSSSSTCTTCSSSSSSYCPCSTCCPCDVSSNSSCSNTSSTRSCYDSCHSISEYGSLTSDSKYSQSECCENACNENNILPDQADPFVKNNECIHSNFNRGVIYEIPLVLGTNKLSKVPGIEQIPSRPLLAVNGDIYVSGHVYSGNIDISQEQFDQHIHAIEPTLDKNGQLQNTTCYHVKPTDNTGILYVNPINGPIYVILGSDKETGFAGTDFKNNRLITIKDTSLHYNEGSSYNVYITVPTSTHPSNQTYIQHYEQREQKLKVSGPGTYVLNSSGGSVSFRFMKPKNKNPCWVIEHQIVGNERVLPGRGLKFNMANEKHLKKLLR